MEKFLMLDKQGKALIVIGVIIPILIVIITTILKRFGKNIKIVRGLATAWLFIVGFGVTQTLVEHNASIKDVIVAFILTIIAFGFFVYFAYQKD